MALPRPVRLAVAAVIAAAAFVVLAKVAARIHHDDVVWGLAGWQLPGDLGVFLIAGDEIRAGENPYPEPGTLQGPPNAYYVYPPLLGLLVTPLSAASISVASTVFTLLGIAAIVGALLLLDVRDWRCHALAFLFPFTREALEYGAIGSFLLLLIAAAWRFRDGLAAPAGSVAVAVALKLFLWPLAVWFALTRRIRTAAATVGIGLAIVLGSWALIAFRGLEDYPSLLRELSELEAEESFSAFALLRAVGLSSPLAQVVVAAAGAALLVAAFRIARARDRDQRDRDRGSLILTLAVALVVTPILWIHYYVLLLLPLALTRPRLAPLWFVPLAALVPAWLGWYGGWALGDIPAIASAFAIFVAVVAGSLWPTGRTRRGRAAARAAASA